MATRLSRQIATTRQSWVHLHAAGWLGFQQSRPVCDEARRWQSHHHRTACHGRGAGSENGTRIRSHWKRRQYQNSLRDVEGYPLRASDDPGSVIGLGSTAFHKVTQTIENVEFRDGASE